MYMWVNPRSTCNFSGDEVVENSGEVKKKLQVSHNVTLPSLCLILKQVVTSIIEDTWQWCGWTSSLILPGLHQLRIDSFPWSAQSSSPSSSSAISLHFLATQVFEKERNSSKNMCAPSLIKEILPFNYTTSSVKMDDGKPSAQGLRAWERIADLAWTYGLKNAGVKEICCRNT